MSIFYTPPKLWRKHRGEILNLRIGHTYVQLWVWGARKMYYKHPANKWGVKLYEFMFWRSV